MTSLRRWAPTAIPTAGAAAPLWDQMAHIMPMPGDQWIYVAIGALFAAVLAGNGDRFVARGMLGERELSRPLHREGIILLAIGIGLLFVYHALDLLTRDNPAPWVYLAFPVAYFFVVGSLSLGTAWLVRDGDSRS